MKVLKEKATKENNPQNTKKTQNTHMHTDKIVTNKGYTNKHSKSPSLQWVTRGRLPQRTVLPGLNGGGTAAAVPPGKLTVGTDCSYTFTSSTTVNICRSQELSFICSKTNT